MMEENHVRMAEIPLFFLFAYYSDLNPKMICVNRSKAVLAVQSFNEFSCLC